MSGTDSPISFRLGIGKTWDSRWFARKKNDFREKLKEDSLFRNLITEKLKNGGIAKIIISRLANTIIFDVYAARPGMIIGRGGRGVEELKELVKRHLKLKTEIKINIYEVSKPELNAVIVAENIAEAIEKRVSFRRVIKQAVERSMQAGAKGVKVYLKGRLDGSDMARREWLKKGQLPLQTIRADIDFGKATAMTTYGTVGVKVWVYKGEILGEENNKENNK